MKQKKVGDVMTAAFPFVDVSAPVDALSAMLTPENPALLVRDFKVDKTYIITRYDVMHALMK
jgi:cystathionine beta-synthase